MKEFAESTSVALEVTDPSTGEKFTATGIKTNTAKYYAIKNITSRVNAMELITVISKVCKSSKDTEVFNFLLDTTNSDGFIVVSNIKKQAENLNVARSKLNKLLKGLEEENFLYKEGTGVYRVNPFIFIGRRIRSNAERERVQIEWRIIQNTKLQEKGGA